MLEAPDHNLTSPCFLRVLFFHCWTVAASILFPEGCKEPRQELVWDSSISITCMSLLLLVSLSWGGQWLTGWTVGRLASNLLWSFSSLLGFVTADFKQTNKEETVLVRTFVLDPCFIAWCEALLMHFMLILWKPLDIFNFFYSYG